MIEAMAATLRRVYALYRSYPRKLFDTGVYVGFASIILGSVSGALVLYAAWYLDLAPANYYYSSYSEYLIDGWGWRHAGLLEGFTILFLTMYMIRVHRDADAMFAGPSLHKVISGLSSRNGTALLIAWLIFFALQLILVKPLFDVHDDRAGLIPLWWGDDSMGTSKAARFLQWANGLIDLLNTLVPYALSLGMLADDRRIPWDRPHLRRLARTLGIIWVLTFCFDSLYRSFWYLIDNHIVPVITIPLGSTALAVTMLLILRLAFTALIIPLLALLVVVPFEQQAGVHPDTPTATH